MRTIAEGLSLMSACDVSESAIVPAGHPELDAARDDEGRHGQERGRDSRDRPRLLNLAWSGDARQATVPWLHRILRVASIGGHSWTRSFMRLSVLIIDRVASIFVAREI